MTISAYIALIVITLFVLSPIVFAAYVIWKDGEEEE